MPIVSDRFEDGEFRYRDLAVGHYRVSYVPQKGDILHLGQIERHGKGVIVSGQPRPVYYSRLDASVALLREARRAPS